MTARPANLFPPTGAEAMAEKIAAWRGRSNTQDLAIAAWREAPSLDWAPLLGISRGYLSGIICEARGRGEDLPRALWGGGKQSPRRRDNTEIIEHFRDTRNLEATGKAFGITRERVRQIVVRHEQESGEHIARGYGLGKMRIERVTWTCIGCGAEKRTLPARVRERCGVCTNRHNSHSKITDALIEEWITARLAGATWQSLAVGFGWPCNHAHRISRAIWSHLIRRGREDEISLLGFNRRTWLRKYTPKGCEHLLETAA